LGHGYGLFELFLQCLKLRQKNKKLPENLGYLFVFLSKPETLQEKFKKSISVAQVTPQKFPAKEDTSQRPSENKNHGKFKDKLTRIGLFTVWWV
jgi:hypothetical protein